jgi:LysR family hydrogen peroxide-inducible transcriptional activator
MKLLGDYAGTSLDSVYQMAASGLGLAILPELYLRSSAGAVGGVRVLNLSGYEMSRHIALLWREEAPFHDTCLLIAKRIRAGALKMLRGRKLI